MSNHVSVMPDCETVRDLLSPLADGELDAASRRTVETHLEACAGCRRELRAIRGVSAFVASTGPVRPPTDLLECMLVSHSPATRHAGGDGRIARQRVLARVAAAMIGAAVVGWSWIPVQSWLPARGDQATARVESEASESIVAVAGTFDSARLAARPEARVLSWVREAGERR